MRTSRDTPRPNVIEFNASEREPAPMSVPSPASRDRTTPAHNGTYGRVDLVCFWSARRHETARIAERQCVAGTLGAHGPLAERALVTESLEQFPKSGIGASNPASPTIRDCD
jgi:hypothetical protein